ncbi:hypothetical protein PR001_g33140 [Phytophthora rubi]|uniref:Uncharacterized protein n=1 Tax=Phytophthora rubi TaxID=129364 RepID=A0A6A3G5C5_9STRA|nr:hypothetical protein PR001_g33140 [Phytophthora rubi]
MNTSPCKPGIWLTSSLPRRSQAYGSRDGYIFIVMVSCLSLEKPTLV